MDNLDVDLICLEVSKPNCWVCQARKDDGETGNVEYLFPNSHLIFR